MTGHAKARMPKAMAAIPRSNTSHQLSAMVRNSATPAKGGLESICVLVIERFPQLEPICFGAGLGSGAELRSLLGLFLTTSENRTPTDNDAIVHLEKLNRSVGVAVPLECKPVPRHRSFSRPLQSPGAVRIGARAARRLDRGPLCLLDEECRITPSKHAGAARATGAVPP